MSIITLITTVQPPVSQPILLPFPGVLPKQSADLAGRDRPFFSRIDALRGLGAVAVAAYHLSGCGIHGRTFLPLEVDSWNDVGSFEYGFGKAISFSIPAHASLMFFFVVSGFVLRLALEHGPTATVPSLGRFAIARIFRFFPIVMAGTVVLAILSRIHLAPEPITSAFSWVDFFTWIFYIAAAVGIVLVLWGSALFAKIYKDIK